MLENLYRLPAYNHYRDFTCNIFIENIMHAYMVLKFIHSLKKNTDIIKSSKYRKYSIKRLECYELMRLYKSFVISF